MYILIIDKLNIVKINNTIPSMNVCAQLLQILKSKFLCLAPIRSAILFTVKYTYNIIYIFSFPF